MTKRDDERPLRIALLTYRGNQRCGGQGVYCYHLSRSLTELGHDVTVFSGPPYPRVAPGVSLVKVPSLDLYRDHDAFRLPKFREISSFADLLEIVIMRAGGFPEARTFGHRVRHELIAREGSFDIIHDNQSLSHALRRMSASGWPVLASVHHPISVDRAVDISHAKGWLKKLSTRRWYGFTRMQGATTKKMAKIVTVSSSSQRDIVGEYDIDPNRIAVVPVGVDFDTYKPTPEIARVAGRIMTTASADVPLKGLSVLLEALAKLRTEISNAHLVVIGKLRDESPVAEVIDRFDLHSAVEFVSGITDEQVVERYASATCAVVPSLYEGFSLPAIEAMACQVPLVATTGGAIPEVVGKDGVTALLVPPGDAGALAGALHRMLTDKELASRIGAAGQQRVINSYSWKNCAEATVAEYRALLKART